MPETLEKSQHNEEDKNHRLAIEVDGKIHERQKEYDELRQRLVEEKRIKFIRVTNEEINRDIGILFSKIVEA